MKTIHHLNNSSNRRPVPPPPLHRRKQCTKQFLKLLPLTAVRSGHTHREYIIISFSMMNSQESFLGTMSSHQQNGKDFAGPFEPSRKRSKPTGRVPRPSSI
ncbi:uncharacterized protein LOC107848313 [Capsicum annuum]|uniref:uncharacterized protein LOC107848313 n=1 Tax=Capsicum annuum TaxID=4072 RepID=UPI001FB06927|nr:uncharacterized protein LOC107848313 [Capsicum annuum]